MESMDSAIQEIQMEKRRKIKKVILILLPVAVVWFFAFSGMISDTRKRDAENVYYLLRAAVSSEHTGVKGFVDLGKGTVSSVEFSKDIKVSYNPTTKEFYIQGINGEGNGEITQWNDVGIKEGEAAIMGFCENWKQLQGYLSNGYTLTLEYVTDHSMGRATQVRTAEEADALLRKIKEMPRIPTEE